MTRGSDDLRERTAGGGQPWLAAAVALALLALIFVLGAYVYIHVGGKLFLQTHRVQGHVPPGLLLLLALVGGGASFFSPCSLAITPSFLMYFVTEETATDRGRLLRGSALVAAGIIVFYAVAGALVTAIGAAIYNVLIYLIPLAATGFLLLGLLILAARADWLAPLAKLNPVQRYYEHALERRAPGALRLFGFGAAYGAASHTCTLPIFLGIVLIPLATGNYLLAGAAVSLYGVAIALLVLLMALLGQQAVARVRRVAGRRLQQATGLLFVLTALYLFYYFGVNYGWSF